MGAFRVLVIDDDATWFELLKALVELAGYDLEMHNAAYLGEAVKRLEGERFDLVLLDLGLPDSVGPVGLKKVVPAARSAPVVVISGLVTDDRARDALSFGAAGCVEKGVGTGEEFIRQLERWLPGAKAP
jgi:CheY-like chemotaxis protein